MTWYPEREGRLQLCVFAEALPRQKGLDSNWSRVNGALGFQLLRVIKYSNPVVAWRTLMSHVKDREPADTPVLCQRVDDCAFIAWNRFNPLGASPAEAICPFGGSLFQGYPFNASKLWGSYWACPQSLFKPCWHFAARLSVTNPWPSAILESPNKEAESQTKTLVEHFIVEREERLLLLMLLLLCFWIFGFQDLWEDEGAQKIQAEQKGSWRVTHIEPARWNATNAPYHTQTHREMIFDDCKQLPSTNWRKELWMQWTCQRI